MSIALDNSRRLNRKNYLFEYKGVRFKLVQDNPRRWSDHLLTILPGADPAKEEGVFATAAEFASALNWENGPCVAVHYAGGRGWSAELPLTQAVPSIRTFPRIANVGIMCGCELTSIPYIRTRDQRVALGLFREANSSNNEFLSFLFYWQVLEVVGGDPVGFINKTLTRDRRHLRFSQSDLDSLPLASRSLGNYLLDDCRHAIAHIKRKPGKKTVDIDGWKERVRIIQSTRVIEAFARFYIGKILGLSDNLYLVRRTRSDFPVFADLNAPDTAGFQLA
jgi:hypothetical protein